jgi:hypothetical protein
VICITVRMVYSRLAGRALPAAIEAENFAEQ